MLLQTSIKSTPDGGKELRPAVHLGWLVSSYNSDFLIFGGIV
jgi:hypothetical protein